MMHKDLFSDGVARIDSDAVERLLQIEQELARRAARRRRGRILSVLAAALLSVMLVSVLLIVPFIPKTLELDYQPSKGMPERVWVYYVNENGKQKRELVKQPQGAQNVFTSWKHLNTVDNEVQLLDYTVTTEPTSSTTVVPNTLWEFLQQELAGGLKTVTATLSPEITSYENYDALIESLIDTLAKYAGVVPEQVKILIDGEQIGIAGTLQFYHSLQDGSAFVLAVTAGSKLEITVGMTNVSDQNIEFTGSWMAFAPSAILTMGNTAVIAHEDFPMTEEYQKYILAPGESREITYTFPIPENAARGEYDLLVTFGEQDFVFEKAVQVIDSTTTGTEYSDFAAFLKQYGFSSADPAEFKQAVASLKYQGTGVFDLMIQAGASVSSGDIEGDIWRGDLFNYEYATFQLDSQIRSQTNVFTATVLPDGMELPCGIRLDHSLIDALFHIGVSSSIAQQVIDVGQDVLISGYEKNGVWLQFDGNYMVIAYTNTKAVIVPGQNGSRQSTIYTVKLYYTADTGTFTHFKIEANAQTKQPGIFEGTPTFTYILGEEVDLVISGEDATKLLDILNNGEWVNEIPVYDEGPGSSCRIGDYTLHYTEGYFMINRHSLELTQEQMIFVENLIERPQSSNTLSGPITVSPYSISNIEYKLNEEDIYQLLTILNGGPWQQGALLGLDRDYGITIAKKAYSYSVSEGILFNSQHYLRLSEQDRLIVNAILKKSGGILAQE